MQIKDRTDLDFALPPQNLDAEEALLGCILLGGDAMSRMADTLPPDAFYINTHKLIYKAALALYAIDEPVDLMSVTSWLYDRDLLEKVGGQRKLVELVECTVTSVNVDRYAKIVADKHLRRQLIQTAKEIELLGRDTSLELNAVFDESEKKLFDLIQARHQRSSVLVPLSDSVVQVFQKIEARSQGAAQPNVPTGFYDIDTLCGGGLGRSDLIIIAGRPSMGKTALSLNMARHIAKTLPVGIFSLEMSTEQLVERLLAGETRIESHRLRSGLIHDSEWVMLSDALGDLCELNIAIADNFDPTISQMRSALRQLQTQQGQLGLVLIDYLQLMETQDNRVQGLGKLTRSLKKMAREFKVPIVVISQLSRAAENRTNKRPVMADLRESGSIEQDADVVAFVYRDEYYHPDTPDRGIAEIIFSKHRNGPTGTVKLLFDSQVTQFKNLAASNPR